MNLKPHTVYQWQIEYQTVTGNSLVVNRFENGRERSAKSIDAGLVIRVSMIPAVAVLPQHDVFIDRDMGEVFEKWFGRVIIKPRLNMTYYLNCIQTNRYRVWVYMDGRVQITDPNKEIYL